jgi:hypothetical protein
MLQNQRSFSARVKVHFEEKSGFIIMDQIGIIAIIRLKEKAGHS